jgi:PAS domain S-box-containing protein
MDSAIIARRIETHIYPGTGGLTVLFRDITERERAAEALREAHARAVWLARFPDENPRPVARVSAEGQVLYCNSVSAQEDAWGCRVGEPAPPWLLPLIHRAVELGEPVERDVEVAGRSFSVTVAPFPAESYVNVYGLDITERKLAEQAIGEARNALEREKEVLQSVMNGARNSHLVYLDRNFDFVRVNETYAKTCGYAPDAMVGKNHFALYPDAENEAIFTRVRDTGIPAESHDKPFVFPDQPERGVTYWDWTLNPVRDAAGNVDGLVFSLVETTDRVRAEQALRESEERYRALVDLAPEAVVVHQKGRYVYANSAGLRLFGAASPEELIGQRVLELIHPMDRDLVAARIQEVAEGGSVPARELRLLRLDGQVILTESAAAPIEYGGRPAVQVILRDVTERRKLEERLAHAQKMEAIGLLAGGVAHDFNNLLVGVIGNASLAQEMLPPNSGALPLLERIVRTGEQAAYLTRQLLAYAGKGQIVMEPVDLSQLVREAADLIRSSIPNKITLHLDLADELPAVRADHGQINQIFMNLAINASEAIGSGPGMISIRTMIRDLDQGSLTGLAGAELRPGMHVCLEVADNGSGMDEETRAKVFDPFFTTKFLGRGLGLAAVAGIVRSHGGGIRVQSEPGRGSLFTVLLPVAEGEVAVAGAEPVAQQQRGEGTILLIDDEEIVLETAKSALERRGYEVLVAASGPAALRLFQREAARVTLVVLDLSMPGMGGDEVLPALRQIRPDVRVVVSSGYSQDQAMKYFQGQSGVGFIQKPHTAVQLAAEVKRAIA